MFFLMEESYRDEELYAKPQDIKMGDEAGAPDTDELTIIFKRSKKMNLLAPLVSCKCVCGCCGCRLTDLCLLLGSFETSFCANSCNRNRLDFRMYVCH